MIPARYHSQLPCSMKRILSLLLLLAAAFSALAPGGPKPQIQPPFTATGQVGVAFSYQISVREADYPITAWAAAGLPSGLTVNTTGVISGTPAWGTDAGSPYSVTLSATNGNGTGTATLTLTILPPPTAFVGFRLPDFPAAATPAPTPSANNMRLILQMGATQAGTAHPFNATLEVQVPGTTTWVPYNRFVGIDDSASWITDAPLLVRELPGSSPAPTPYPSPPAFSPAQLTTEMPPPGVYMKADPRSTRFGIFQMDTNPTGNSRIIDSIWPRASAALQNGYGGAVATSFPGPVEHSPNRWPAGTTYYPATLCINGPPDARDTATTTYLDNDGVQRPADAIYPGAATTTGSSTPYYYDPANPTTSIVYHPIMLNRPFRNVAELGYVFRDLPWKTLDFFTDKSADAGLLDIFTINGGALVSPTMAAGSVNLNGTQATDLQPVLAGTILNELDSTNTVSNAPVLAANIVDATNPIANPAATPMQNKAELITRTGLPTAILPTASNDNQAVKARREVVPRAISSVSQTRVWNVLIDVVAQSGRYAPGETDLRKFNVQGEQHYWIHVAIDRFTGQVLDKQIEVVNE